MNCRLFGVLSLETVFLPLVRSIAAEGLCRKYILKGQHILAQGNALGLRMGERIVREIALI